MGNASGIGTGIFGNGLMYASSGAFLPSDVTGLVTWWDFSLITKLWQDTGGTSQVSADGQTIKRCDDRSTSTYNITEDTNGPTYKASIKNGRSVGRFDGTNDKLRAGATLNLGTSHTICIAFNPTSITAEDVILGTDEGARPFCIQTGGGSQTQYIITGASVAFTIISTGWQVATIRRSTTTVGLYVNGTQVGTDQTLGANNALNETLDLGCYLAGFFFFTGDVGEVAIYNTPLSTTDRQSLETYMIARWT